MREDRVHLFLVDMDTLPEVVRGRRRRRRHSEEFKARVVAQCRRPGVSGNPPEFFPLAAA